MFRKDKKMVSAWEEHGPDFFCNIQKSIILQAARMLKQGGMMLYSTCTFDPKENEQVTRFALLYKCQIMSFPFHFMWEYADSIRKRRIP